MLATGVGGKREKFEVAAICVLMGFHKGNGAATLRGDKRILRNAFSDVVAINGKMERGEEDEGGHGVPLLAGDTYVYTCIARQ